MFDYGTFDHLTFDQAPEVASVVVNYVLTAETGTVLVLGWDAVLRTTTFSRPPKDRYDYGWECHSPPPGKFGSKVY